MQFKFLDAMKIDDCPISPVKYWLSQLKLEEAEIKRLLEGIALTGRYMNGTSLLLSEQVLMFYHLKTRRCENTVLL